MGLDQYVYKHPMLTVEQEKLTGHESKQIAYFRKENWLNAAIETELGTEVENCTPTPITRAQIESIIEKISTVLNTDEDDRERVARDVLPTQEGFFFGWTDYDEWYFNGLKEARREFAQILDGNADEQFDYYIWW